MWLPQFGFFSGIDISFILFTPFLFICPNFGIYTTTQFSHRSQEGQASRAKQCRVDWRLLSGTSEQPNTGVSWTLQQNQIWFHLCPTFAAGFRCCPWHLLPFAWVQANSWQPRTHPHNWGHGLSQVQNWSIVLKNNCPSVKLQLPILQRHYL